MHIPIGVYPPSICDKAFDLLCAAPHLSGRFSDVPMIRCPDPLKTLSLHLNLRYKSFMTHQQLVRMAEQWLRTRYRCGIVLSEQSCASGETPDVIAWKGKCRSVVVECKVSRADFFADQEKPFRKDPELAMGCERFYLAPQGLITLGELPPKWGLLECKGREVRMAVKACRLAQRSQTGLMWEMNLLLASLRRVEVRIEPQTITDFLKWKNRLAEYNGGRLPEGVVAPEAEPNVHLV
jgi:hypothetical protein